MSADPFNITITVSGHPLQLVCSQEYARCSDGRTMPVTRWRLRDADGRLCRLTPDARRAVGWMVIA